MPLVAEPSPLCHKAFNLLSWGKGASLLASLLAVDPLNCAGERVATFEFWECLGAIPPVHDGCRDRTRGQWRLDRKRL